MFPLDGILDIAFSQRFRDHCVFKKAFCALNFRIQPTKVLACLEPTLSSFLPDLPARLLKTLIMRPLLISCFKTCHEARVNSGFRTQKDRAAGGFLNGTQSMDSSFFISFDLIT